MAAFADRVITVRDGLIVSDQRTAPAHGSPASMPRRTRPQPPETPRRPRSAAVWSFGRMALVAAAPRARAQQAPLGADDARHLHRRRCAHRHGGRRTGGERRGRGRDREPRHEPARRPARRDHQQRRASGIRQRVDAHRVRRGGDPEGRCPRSPPSAISTASSRRSQYGNQNWSTSIQGVTPSYLAIRNWPLAGGTPAVRADERDARPRLPPRPDGAEEPLRRASGSGRRHGAA